MSKNTMSAGNNRDVMLAFSVGQMLEWGLFDEEFSTFGLSFWEDNTQKYLISLHEQKIYAHFMSGGTIDQYPLPCLVSRKFYTGASGCGEAIDRDIKLEMAKKLRECYPQQAYARFVAFAAAYEPRL